MEDTLQLRPFDIDQDFPRLAAWLAKPHVSHWWPDREAQLDQARERPPGSGHVVIYLGGTPIGYMRWQRPDVAALKEIGLSGIPEGSVDMDILIGEQNLLGQGIGRRAVQLLREKLFTDKTIPLIGMVTSIENKNAIRAFKAAGFSPSREYLDPRYGPCLVLITSRTENCP